jgi:hypothetical protein
MAPWGPTSGRIGAGESNAADLLSPRVTASCECGNRIASNCPGAMNFNGRRECMAAQFRRRLLSDDMVHR